MNDGTATSAPATVTITLTNSTPVATAQAVSTTIDEDKAITLAGTDPNGDVLTYAVATQPTQGSVSGTAAGACTYHSTPACLATTPSTFTGPMMGRATPRGRMGYVILQRSAHSRRDTVDAPRPVAMQLVLTASDPNGDPLTYELVDLPAKGAIGCVAAVCTYTSAAGQTGTDSFTFRASDGTATSATATVTIHLTNTAPTATAQSLSTPVHASASITLGGADANADDLTFSVAAQPSKGSLTCSAGGACTYQSATGVSGDDTFTFTSNDGESDSAPATVTVHLTNTKPVAAGQAVDAPRRVAMAITLDGSDANGDSLTYTVVTQPAKGLVSCSAAGDCSYASAAGQTGTDSFTFTVDDGTEDSDPGDGDHHPDQHGPHGDRPNGGRTPACRHAVRPGGQRPERRSVDLLARIAALEGFGRVRGARVHLHLRSW